MKKYLFVIIVTLFLIFIISCDQVDQATEADSDPAEELVSTTWIKTFGSSTGHEEGKQVIQTSDGLYVAVGITTGILVEDDSLPDNYLNNIYVLKANRELH